MAALLSAEDSKFVLQAHDVDIADIEKIGRAKVRREVLFLDLETNHLRILVAAGYVVHGNSQALALRVGRGDSGQQVGRERRNTALSRQMVTDKCNPADLRVAVHEVTPFAARRTFAVVHLLGYVAIPFRAAS